MAHHHIRPQRQHRFPVLLGSVATAAITIGGAGLAQTSPNCTEFDPDTLVCSGDLTAGVVVDPPYGTLIVENLTGDVGDVGDVTGIRFDHGGDITADIDTSGFTVFGNAAGTNGIHLTSFGGAFTVDLDFTGTVVADTGVGILATGGGDVDVMAMGDVTATGNGIEARSFGAGAVMIDYTGTALSYDGTTIIAAGGGPIDVMASGDLTGNTGGIYANTYGGDISVAADGTITVWNGPGIDALGNAAVDIAFDGSITSGGDAVRASSYGGSTDVMVTGTLLESWNGDGIEATSSYFGVSVESEIDIIAKQHGIVAQSTASAGGLGLLEGDPLPDVSVHSDGDITAYDGDAIIASATVGGVEVMATGTLTAGSDGILATGTGDFLDSTIDVDFEGSIEAFNGYGIFADASTRGVSVAATGDITSSRSGIYAESTGDTADATVSVETDGGTITSYSGDGIQARSAASSVMVDNASDVIAQQNAIDATMTQNNSLGSGVSVINSGALLTHQQYGIYATATEAGVDIENSGGIDGNLGGIYATANGDTDGASVVIDNQADITVFNNSAIYGTSASRGVEVTHGSGTLSGGSFGINAMSGTEDVAVTIDEGGVIEGMNTAALQLQAITGVTVENHGMLDGGEWELAIATEGFGGTLIDNHGTIYGSINLNNQYSILNNHEGGVLDAFDLAFQQGGEIYNSGVISSGGMGAIRDAHFGADLYQDGTGVLLADVGAATVDRVVVAGNAELEGGVQLAFADFQAGRELEVLTAWNIGVQDLDLLNPAVVGTITYPASAAVVVDFEGYDFAPETISASAQNVGAGLNSAFGAGPSGLDPLLLDLVNVADTETYEEALEGLGGVSVGGAIQQLELASLGFASQLMSCPAGAGTSRVVGQSSCVWNNVFYAEAEGSTATTGADYQTYIVTPSVGAQYQLDGGFFVGAAIGLTDVDVQTEDGVTADQSMTDIGLALKYVNGSLRLAGALSFSGGDLDATRMVDVLGVTQTLSSSRDLAVQSLLLRATYGFEMQGGTFLRPSLDLSATRFDLGAGTETGGSAALSYAALDNTSFVVSPSVEIGHMFSFSNGHRATPFVHLGGFQQYGREYDFAAQFASAGATSQFTTPMGENDQGATVGLGLEYAIGESAAVNFRLNRSIGDHTTVNDLSVRGQIRF